MIRALVTGYVLGAIAALEVIAASLAIRRAQRFLREWDRSIESVRRTFGVPR